MEPVLIGYFPKRTMQRPDWLKSAGVVEICSTSNCISSGPENWVDHWQHNEMWVYDTPELAWSVVPEDERSTYDLYAYQIYPVRFTQDGQQTYTPPPLQIQPLSPNFELLGYDAVSRCYDNSFECSPLSCNHMAEEIHVNPHCLLDDSDTALVHAAKFEASGCEPGPYYVVAVWRLKQVPRAQT